LGNQEIVKQHIKEVGVEDHVKNTSIIRDRFSRDLNFIVII